MANENEKRSRGECEFFNDEHNFYLKMSVRRSRVCR